MEMSTHDPIIIIIIILLLIMEEPDQPAAHTHRVDCSILDRTRDEQTETNNQSVQQPRPIMSKGKHRSIHEQNGNKQPETEFYADPS
jgi:hypothetical protein